MSDADTLVGAQLGPYRIEKLLGEGAMGEVFLAIHEALGRHVAIKKLKPAIAANPTMTERFFAEARAVNIIRHENIVECTDLVNNGANSYIVMELLEGKTLSAAIRDARKLPPARAAKIAAQIADALAAAHGKGIVHRDLKPDNVFLIKRAGSSDYVKVLDFGMARLRPELGGVGSTQSGALIGTPAYMSPEQARGEKVGPAADIYALGVVLFHMLTGQLPFAAESLTMMLIAIVQETPPRIDTLAKDLPKPLVELVERCLDKDADKRPPDMATLRRQILESVGLPAETAQSTAGTQSSPLASIVSPSVALGATLDTGPRAKVSAAEALGETVAPVPAPAWAGQSSVSAAAGEIARPPKRSRAVLWGVGAVAALAIAGVVGRIALHSDAHAPTAASSPSPAAASAPAPTPAPPSEPAPTPVETAPAPTPTAAPAPVAQPTPPPPTTTPKKTTVKKVTPAKTTAKVGTGSAGSAAPPPVTQPPPEQKIDRTKQLVGPTPVGS